MKTTLNQIRANSPCGIRPESDGTLTGWLKLKQYLGEDFGADAPIDIRTIIDSNGLDDALWCLSSVIGRDREHRLYAVWCTRQVQHLMTDQRSLDALDVAERFANGLATKEELAAAAAWVAAARAAAAAWVAAARAAARAAAYAAARSAQEKRLRELCAECALAASSKVYEDFLTSKEDQE